MDSIDIKIPGIPGSRPGRVEDFLRLHRRAGPNTMKLQFIRNKGHVLRRVNGEDTEKMIFKILFFGFIPESLRNLLNSNDFHAAAEMPDLA